MASDIDDDGYVLRIRGLPWSATKEEIMKFFSGCNIQGGGDGIHMTLSREGRPSGESYVEMETEEDLEKGLGKHNDNMGHRYIEVFKSKRSEMEWVIKRSGAHQEDSLNDGCVRLRGLPFGCSKEEIAQFFSGLEIVPNGISLPTDYQGRSTGEAYVQFASRDIAEKAMGKHKEKIGHRYIEIFKSSLHEIRGAFGMGGPKMRPLMSNRPGPYDRNDRFRSPVGRFGMGRGSRNFRGFIDDDYDNYGGSGFGSGYGGNGGFGNRDGYGSRDGPSSYLRESSMDSMRLFGNSYNGNSGGRGSGGGGGYGATGHCVHMRGLPFRAIEQDVYDFFRPLNPVNVRIRYDNSGRPSGEADVEFGSHEEAVKAMSKDKANMQHRYIELFLNSTPSPMSGGSGGGGPGGFGGSPIGSGGQGGGIGFGSGMGSPMGGGSGGGRFGGGMGGGGSGGGGSGYYSSGGMGGGYGNHHMGGGGGMGSMMGGTNYTAF